MKKIFLFLSVILLSSLKAMAAEPYALLSGSGNNKTLTFYYGTKPADGMSVGPFNLSTGSPRGCGWTREWENITTVVFDASMDNCHSITSTAGWFYSMAYLTTITHLDYLHTENVTDMQYMFAYCRALENLDMSHFITAKVTDMKYMFQDCRSLESLNLSTFNTSNVTNMEQMFGHSPSLTSINLSSFNTANVTNMKYMFYNCSSLTSLDLSGFNTGKVTDMSSMFLYCTNLTSLDVSGFNTGSVTNMNGMFADCSSLKTIYCYDTWNPSSSQGMFIGCTSLIGGDGTLYSADNVTAAYAHPNDGGYFSKKIYALLSNNNTKLTFYYGVKPTNGMDVKPFNSAPDRGWQTSRKDITTVKFDNSMANCRSIRSTAFWFRNLQNLTTFDGLEKLITSNVEDMQFMFGDMRSMPNLDLSTFDTRNVKNFHGLFSASSGFQSIDVSSFDTGNATDMVAMFQGCSGLTSLNLMNFNTENVTDMYQMFYNCKSLQAIYCQDTWNPNTSSKLMFGLCTSLKGGLGFEYDSNCTTAAYANPGERGYFTTKEPYALLSDNNTKLTFYYGEKPADGMSVGPFTIANDRGWYNYSSKIATVEFNSSMADCNTITSTRHWFSRVNMSNIEGLKYLNTENVTDMSYMFYNCSSLTSIDLSHFDTHNVKNMDYLFGYSKLSSIDVSSFDTENVENMEGLFYICSNLTSLDLRNFNTEKVTNMYRMFYQCTSLQTIYCNDTWNPNTSSNEMFLYCFKLKGGNGTTYDDNNVTAAYAHPNASGYFTEKQIILGDVNDEGSVTPADAIMILYHYFGVAQNGFHRLAADVNGDGNITPADAIETLYIYFGAGSHNGTRAARPATVDARDPE